MNIKCIVLLLSMLVSINGVAMSSAGHKYMIVDLSGGDSVQSYPITYTNEEPKEGWSDEYKTTKLVLRCIHPGTFTMGDSIHGGLNYSNIVISKTFYLGIFELTVKQYQLITGETPSTFIGDARPVQNVSYEMIRGVNLGGQWPTAYGVDQDSFMGKLRSKTGCSGFDLPTEAQWEYACRGGTESDYNDGSNIENSLCPSTLGNICRCRTFYSATGPIKVGSLNPNFLGLYDMHGNIDEICLDWFSNTLQGCVTNPVGVTVGSSRVVRGGNFNEAFTACTSYYRSGAWPSTKNFMIGFRVSCRGVVDAPTIMPMKHEFSSGRLNIAIIGAEDTTIRYTCGGADVTENSPVYSGEFDVRETTIVKAKAFKDGWYESEEVSTMYTRIWYTCEAPIIEAAANTFATTSQEVTLSCETDGATIYYTIDGSEPSAANGRVYTGPFNIYQTTTVKAIAVKDDWKDSAVATATFTKSNTLGPAMNLLEMLPDNDALHPWTVVTDVTHDGVSAVRSGTITHEQSTTLKTVVYGAGRLSFWWKTACEPSVDGEYYDYATFYNGSTAVTNLAGVTDWQQVMLRVDGTGKHTFKWTYQKDDSGTTPSDCVWVDQVQWLPDTTDYYSDHTLTTETPVPYAWLEHYGYGTKTDYESAANSTLGKRDSNKRLLRVEDDYVAGTDPTNITSVFTTDISMENEFPEITWWPDLNEGGTKSLRNYKIWGKAALDDGSDWEYPTNSLHRFFKVSVEMP